MRSILFNLFMFCGAVLFTVTAQAQCGCTNCPLSLPDDLDTPFTANVGVDNTANNTLGVNNTLEQVCIDISHDWIGDLDITLTAPDGTSVVLYADGNSDSSLGGTELCPCGESGDDMNVCFVLPGNAGTSGNGANTYDNIFGTTDSGDCSDIAYADPCNGSGTDPCFTGDWEPWDAGCNGTGGLNEFNNGTGTVSGNWTITINDNAGSNSGTLNDIELIFSTPPDGDCTSTVVCSPEPDAGTYTVDDGSLSGGVWEVFLCDNAAVNVTSNDDYVLPTPAGLDPTTLGYAIYDCAPTTSNPDTDPCFSGWYFTGEDISEINATGNNYEFLEANPIAGFAAVSGNDLYLVPVTMDDACNDILLLCDNSLGHDVNGDGCFDMGVPIHITYLPQVTITVVSDCDPSTNSGTISFTINGGTPQLNGSNFTITSTGDGTPDVTTLSDGGTVIFSGLTHGNTVTFNLSDDNCDYGNVSEFFDCGVDACLINSTLTADPPVTSFPNNQYPPNTEVTFCFTIDEYIQTGNNFLHGIVVSLSGEWDETTLINTINPNVAGNNEIGSFWDWLPPNSVEINADPPPPPTSAAIPIDDYGWWFFSVNTPGGVPTDADDGWGDGCTRSCYPDTDQFTCELLGYTWYPGCGCTSQYSFSLWVGPNLYDDIFDVAMDQTYCESLGGFWDTGLGNCNFHWCDDFGVDGTNFQWTGCFKVTTLDCVDPINNPNGGLGVSIKTWADGQTGAWDDLGCTADQPVTVDYTLCCIPPPTVSSPLTFCENDNIVLNATLTDGTYDVNWYSSNPPTLPIHSGTSYNPNLAPGDYTFYVEQNNNGCRSDLDSIEVTINPLPTVEIVDFDQEICNGESANINTLVDFETSISWTNTASTTESISVSPAVTTDYEITATNACGDSIRTVTINVYEVPDISTLTASPTICIGDSYDLSNVAINDNVAWPIGTQDTTITFHSGLPATGANELPSLTVSPSATTTYYVVSTNNICDDNFSFTVNVNNLPTANTLDIQVCADDVNDYDLVTNNDGNTVNTTETVTWYDGQPSSGGTLIADPTLVDLQNVDLWALVNDGTCTNEVDITYTVLPNTNPACGCNDPDFIGN